MFCGAWLVGRRGMMFVGVFFFSSRRRHTRCSRDWSSDVCSSDLSFTVSPIKQIFYCFGCGKGGDVYNFVMDMEKCEFPEAVKLVAEKCGISIPRPKERSPGERKENQQRATLVEMHREAQTFFVKQLEGTLEGKAACAYLEDPGMDKDAISRFGIGYAPSGGDTLLRHLKAKYPEKLLVDSGLISRDQGGKGFCAVSGRLTFPNAD